MIRSRRLILALLLDSPPFDRRLPDAPAESCAFGSLAAPAILAAARACSIRLSAAARS